MKRAKRYINDIDYYDIFTILFIIFATILGFFVNAYYQNIDPVLSNRIIAVMILIYTLPLRFILAQARLSNDFVYDNNISENEASKYVITTLLGFVMLTYTTYYVLKQSKVISLSIFTNPSQSIEDLKYASLVIAFLACSAIAEEILFRVILYSFFSNFFKILDIFNRFGFDHRIFAMVFVSGLFSAFHVGVYGMVNYIYIILVFMNGLILTILYEYTHRVTIPIVIHVFNNMMASGVLLVYWGLLSGSV